MREVDEFIADGMERVGWSPKTGEAYRSHLRSLVAFAVGRLGREPEPGDIDGDLIQRHDTARARAGAKQRSRAAMQACYFSFVRWLCRGGKVSKEQLAAVLETPRVRVSERPRRRYATGQQVRAMLDACPRISENHTDRLAYRARLAAAVLAVLAYTGGRRAEVCALAIADVDLTGGVATITFRKGKGGKARTLPLHSEAVKHLRRWLDRRPTDSPSLFAVPVRTRGREDVPTPLSPMRLVGLLREARELAEIEDDAVVAPHAYRRFAASALLRSGASLKVVSEFLGHASLAVTEKYCMLDPDEMQENVEKMKLVPATKQTRFRVERIAR